MNKFMAFTLILLLTVTTACSDVEFAVKKADLLAKSDVLGDGNNDNTDRNLGDSEPIGPGEDSIRLPDDFDPIGSGEDSIRLPDDFDPIGSGEDSIRLPDGSEPIGSGEDSVRVPNGSEPDRDDENPMRSPNSPQFLCSNVRTQRNGTNILKSSELAIVILDLETNEEVCRVTEGVRERLLETKQLIVPSCPEMTKDAYIIRLVDPAKPSSNLLYQDMQNKRVAMARSSNGSWKYSDSDDAKSYKERPDLVSLAFDDLSDLYVLYDVKDKMSQNHKNCDRSASPLIVDMRSDVSQPKGISLSSPLDGILFDILGLNSFPRAHSPKQISWVHNSDYMFVVKPDAQGQVRGINEMFGDNTLGPDGKFADNGFHALAKYDGTDAQGLASVNEADGRIDQDDAVYTELRLWSDSNFDGISQPGELFTLDQAGIEFIDLEYDPTFSEVDKYGNRTEMKSAVQFKDGELRLIFDLWFRYL